MRKYRKKPVVIEAVQFLAGNYPAINKARYYRPEHPEGECCYIDTLEEGKRVELIPQEGGFQLLNPGEYGKWTDGA